MITHHFPRRPLPTALLYILRVLVHLPKVFPDSWACSLPPCPQGESSTTSCISRLYLQPLEQRLVPGT